MHVTFRNMYLDYKKCLTQGKSLRAVPLPAPHIENTYQNKFQGLPCKILGNYSDRDSEWCSYLFFFLLLSLEYVAIAIHLCFAVPVQNKVLLFIFQGLTL